MEVPYFMAGSAQLGLLKMFVPVFIFSEVTLKDHMQLIVGQDG